MASQLVQDPETDLKMRKSLIKLSSCLKLSSLFASQLQDNCQISLNNLQPREKVATIGVLIKEVNVMFTAKLKKKEMILNSFLCKSLKNAKYSLEYERVQQVYMNLLQNAIDASKNYSTLTLGV